MPLHALRVEVLPYTCDGATQCGILRYEIRRENRLVTLGIGQQRDGETVLFRVKTITHELRVIVGQVYVVNVYDNACLE